MTTIYQQPVSSRRKYQCAEWKILARAQMRDFDISSTSTYDNVSCGHSAVPILSTRLHSIWAVCLFTSICYNEVFVTTMYMYRQSAAFKAVLDPNIPLTGKADRTKQ